MTLSDSQIDQLNEKFEAESPETILRWAVDAFGSEIAASSSFQTQGAPLLHLISRATPDLPIIFIDTGYHFPQTLAYRDRLVAAWRLNLRVVRSSLPRERLVQQYGPDLYHRNPDLCCYVNKVAPMQQVTRELTAWISGIRRDQSAARARTRIVEKTTDDLIRIHPMAAWTRHDIWQYIHDHQLPEHPLLAQGYLSIGCAPCTRPVQAGQDERTGRWAGQTKTECGLHTTLKATNGRLTEPTAPVYHSEHRRDSGPHDT